MCDEKFHLHLFIANHRSSDQYSLKTLQNSWLRKICDPENIYFPLVLSTKIVNRKGFTSRYCTGSSERGCAMKHFEENLFLRNLVYLIKSDDN